MEGFVKRMIEEHSELVVRIDKLAEYVYTDKSDKDNKVEFANKAIQLSAMRKYEECLRARLENQNVIYSDGQYFEKCGEVVETPENDSPDEKPANGNRKSDK